MIGLGLPVAGLAAQETEPAVETRLRRLTVRQKAAQLIMPWVTGAWAAWDDSTLLATVRLVDSLEVGGVVISIGTPGDVVLKLNHLQRQARLPLLVAADFEYGTAFRLAGGTGFPTNMGVGASGSEADAYAMGRIIAEEGRALGVHLGFSPVADVNNNPANPIINTRSFGGDPALVGRLVAAQIRGMQDHGMVATAKHFPGHGDTSTDSHIGLPVVVADWNRLRAVELEPFRTAVAAGVGAVMSAHVALPALDSGRIRPATMVPEILTGILRDSLGFGGLIITDALDMGGVINGYGREEAAVQALLAGADILLMPVDPVAAVEAIAAAVAGGRVSEARLDASVRRLLALKERLGLFANRTVDPERLGEVMAQRAFVDAADSASARSLVLLRDTDGVVASLRGGPQSVTLISYGESNWATAGVTLGGELRRQGHRVTTFRLSPASGAESYDSASRAMTANAITIVAASVRVSSGKGSVVMPAALEALLTHADQAGPTLLVSLGSPYLIRQVPSVPGYLLAWTSTGSIERAVAAALGGAPIDGRLPVEIPPHFLIGAGLREPRP